MFQQIPPTKQEKSGGHSILNRLLKCIHHSWAKDPKSYEIPRVGMLGRRPTNVEGLGVTLVEGHVPCNMFRHT